MIRRHGHLNRLEVTPIGVRRLRAVLHRDGSAPCTAAAPWIVQCRAETRWRHGPGLAAADHGIRVRAETKSEAITNRGMP